MLKINRLGVIIRGSGKGFEQDGVLNPGVIQEGNVIHVFYRAVATGNYSSIGYCKLKSPVEVIEQGDKPVLFPQFDYELQGVEDPRLVKIDDTYYMSYTAFDGVNALGALATSQDLVTFTKHGLICPAFLFSDFKRLAEVMQPLNEKYVRYNKRENRKMKRNKPVYMWIKNLVFFPRRIHGKLVFMQRIKPDIQLVSVENLDELTQEFWELYMQNINKNIMMEPKFPHEVSYIGAGCPPIETSEGWLMIYHGVHDSPSGYVYCACAALFDINDPCKELARLPYPLFQPELSYEVIGEVDNVCFPTGTAIVDNTLYIYYGAADDMVACASVSMVELLQELSLYPTIHA